MSFKHKMSKQQKQNEEHQRQQAEAQAREADLRQHLEDREWEQMPTTGSLGFYLLLVEVLQLLNLQIFVTNSSLHFVDRIVFPKYSSSSNHLIRADYGNGGMAEPSIMHLLFFFNGKIYIII